MRIIGSSCRRRGISSILGIIIFVGIMFTAVIPMFLVMNQADTIHEMRKFELERFDQERRDEDIHVYVFPDIVDPTILTLRVQNRGSLVVNVVQVWINDITYLFEDFVVPPMGSRDKLLDAFDLEDGTYYFTKITTDRGNVFPSDSGSLHYLGDGFWDGGMFAINFLISYDAGGYFDVYISYSDENGDPSGLVEGTPFQIHKTAAGPAFGFFSVDTEGKYYVRIERGDEEIYDKSVTIEWPLGPPVVWVFA